MKDRLAAWSRERDGRPPRMCASWNLSHCVIDHGLVLSMNELSIGWHDVIVFLGKPLFVLGDTPLSPIRILVILFAIKLALWISRFGEQTLRRPIQRRTTPLSEESAYALGASSDTQKHEPK
jgi:hypothetical protein